MKKRGLTLAELLIALVIMGIIATFTIPKVLTSQQDSRYKTIAKEAAGMVSEAYQAYQIENGSSPAMRMSYITPFLNYIRYDTTTTIDLEPTSGSALCGSATYRQCLALHNGAMLRYSNLTNFGGTASTNALWFSIDPDGIDSSVEAVVFYLYYDGKVRTEGTLEDNTCNSTLCNSANPAKEPPWFSWD